MKKILSTAIAVIILLCIALTLSVTASQESSVNGVKNIKKNDTITYTLKLSDCKEPIVGLQMYIIYDENYLEPVEDSFETPELSNSVCNVEDSVINFNWTDIMNMGDFSENKVLVTVDFKVINKGKTDITYFVSEMYGEDMTYLKSYRFSYDLLVNGKPKLEREIPILTKNEEFLNKRQGMFINYVDGKGKENGEIEGITRETVMGVTEAPAGSSPKGAELSVKAIIIICSVIILVGLIVFVAIINSARKRNAKK